MTIVNDWASYASHARALTGTPVACLGAGEYRGRDGGFRGRELRSHGAVVISEGTGWFSSASTGELDVHAPALLWLPPGIAHGYGPHRSGWAEHWVLFSGAATRMLDDLRASRGAKPVVALDRLPMSLGSTFARLRPSLAENTSINALRASATTYSWIVELETMTVPRSDPDLIAALTRGAHRQVSMDMRARELGLSLAQLRAATMAATGRLPLQLLIEARLARAQSLLVESDLEVSEIGRRVGFEDPSYFSRQFAQRTGSSPSRFRREQRRLPNSTNGLA